MLLGYPLLSCCSQDDKSNKNDINKEIRMAYLDDDSLDFFVSESIDVSGSSLSWQEANTIGPVWYILFSSTYFARYLIG